MDEQYKTKMVEALQTERAGYVERGLKDRVQQVDKQLAFYGGKPEKPKPKAETAAEKKKRLAAEAEAEQAAFDALSDEDKAALAALTADELAALQDAPPAE